MISLIIRYYFLPHSHFFVWIDFVLLIARVWPTCYLIGPIVAFYRPGGPE
jgi:hypothetical protein